MSGINSTVSESQRLCDILFFFSELSTLDLFRWSLIDLLSAAGNATLTKRNRR